MAKKIPEMEEEVKKLSHILEILESLGVVAEYVTDRKTSFDDMEEDITKLSHVMNSLDYDCSDCDDIYELSRVMSSLERNFRDHINSIKHVGKIKLSLNEMAFEVKQIRDNFIIIYDYTEKLLTEEEKKDKEDLIKRLDSLITNKTILYTEYCNSLDYDCTQRGRMKNSCNYCFEDYVSGICRRKGCYNNCSTFGVIGNENDRFSSRKDRIYRSDIINIESKIEKLKELKNVLTINKVKPRNVNEEIVKYKLCDN